MFNLTAAGAIHTVLACVGIAFGAIQFLRRKAICFIGHSGTATSTAY
jgi:hypothetical protein